MYVYIARVSVYQTFDLSLIRQRIAINLPASYVEFIMCGFVCAELTDFMCTQVCMMAIMYYICATEIYSTHAVAACTYNCQYKLCQLPVHTCITVCTYTHCTRHLLGLIDVFVLCANKFVPHLVKCFVPTWRLNQLLYARTCDRKCATYMIERYRFIF